MGRRGRKRRSIGRADRSATSATDRPSIARDGDDGAATRRIAGSARARVARGGGEGDPASRARRGGLASRGRRGFYRAHLSGDVYHARVRHRDRPSRVERIPSRARARGRSFPIKSATPRRVDRSPGLARARLARPLFAEPNARAHSERATDARSSGRFESTVPRRRALPSRARRRPFPSRRVTVSGKAEGGTARAGAKKPSLD